MNNLSAGSNVIYQTNEKIVDISFSYFGNFIAVLSESGIIKTLNTSDYSEKDLIKCKEGSAMSITWNADNELIVGFASGKIEIWNKEEYQEVFVHSSGINDLFFDNENHRLITCSYDGIIKIWDYWDFDIEPIIVDSHDSWVYCIAVTPNKANLISGSKDKSIIINNINTEILKTLVRKEVEANMSHKNWLKFVGEGIEYKNELPED